MPRFYFHLSSRGSYSIDETGTEFSCLEAAYLDTCSAILDMAVEALRARRDPAGDAFEIADEQGNVLMEVPFSEVLSPVASGKQPVRLETVRIWEGCRRRAASNLALIAEIREEFEQARTTFKDIRATLATVVI